MKTADEILKEHHYVRQDPEVNIDNLVKIINAARIDAIKECAEMVTCSKADYRGRFTSNDKESILNLINQVK